MLSKVVKILDLRACSCSWKVLFVRPTRRTSMQWLTLANSLIALSASGVWGGVGGWVVEKLALRVGALSLFLLARCFLYAKDDSNA